MCVDLYYMLIEEQKGEREEGERESPSLTLISVRIIGLDLYNYASIDASFSCDSS